MPTRNLEFWFHVQLFSVFGNDELTWIFISVLHQWKFWFQYLIVCFTFPTLMMIFLLVSGKVYHTIHSTICWLHERRKPKRQTFIQRVKANSREGRIDFIAWFCLPLPSLDSRTLRRKEWNSSVEKRLNLAMKFVRILSWKTWRRARKSLTYFPWGMILSCPRQSWGEEQRRKHKSARNAWIAALRREWKHLRWDVTNRQDENSTLHNLPPFSWPKTTKVLRQVITVEVYKRNVYIFQIYRVNNSINRKNVRNADNNLFLFPFFFAHENFASTKTAKETILMKERN